MLRGQAGGGRARLSQGLEGGPAARSASAHRLGWGEYLVLGGASEGIRSQQAQRVDALGEAGKARAARSEVGLGTLWCRSMKGGGEER